MASSSERMIWLPASPSGIGLPPSSPLTMAIASAAWTAIVTTAGLPSHRSNAPDAATTMAVTRSGAR